MHVHQRVCVRLSEKQSPSLRVTGRKYNSIRTNGCYDCTQLLERCLNCFLTLRLLVFLSLLYKCPSYSYILHDFAVILSSSSFLLPFVPVSLPQASLQNVQ